MLCILALVSHNHKLLRRAGHHLLPGVGCPAALDDIEPVIHLVRPVYGQIQNRMLV